MRGGRGEDVVVSNAQRRGETQSVFCIVSRLEQEGDASPPRLHDTVADKSLSVRTMGGFEMVVNLIDKAKQWHNACRPITFLFV